MFLMQTQQGARDNVCRKKARCLRRQWIFRLTDMQICSGKRVGRNIHKVWIFFHHSSLHVQLLFLWERESAKATSPADLVNRRGLQ
jgi:hypothetical protein